MGETYSWTVSKHESFGFAIGLFQTKPCSELQGSVNACSKCRRLYGLFSMSWESAAISIPQRSGTYDIISNEPAAGDGRQGGRKPTDKEVLAVADMSLRQGTKDPSALAVSHVSPIVLKSDRTLIVKGAVCVEETHI